MPATLLFGSTNVDQGLQLLFCVQAPHRTEWAGHTGCLQLFQPKSAAQK